MSTSITDLQPSIEPPAQSDPDWLAAELDYIIAGIGDRIANQRLPISTYRLQFNSQFTFRQAMEIVPYLARLGISDVYASPLWRARAGSMHGYDVVSHAELDPEIGTRAEFDELCRVLRESGMGLLLDIVPNHMAASSDENAWWRDVLENGPSSPFASYFDIDWSPVKSDLENRLLLPVLGDQYGKVLEDGQLVLVQDEGSFALRYFQRTFPIEPRSYEMLLSYRLDLLRSELGPENPELIELLSILTAIGNLPPFTETATERVHERQREKEVIKRRLKSLLAESSKLADFVAENVRLTNGERGDPRSFDRLDELLQNQPYRLAYWRVAADEINYRRFFDVNELAAICVERPPVFEAVHRLVFELLDAGQVSGLRIDHPDGLFDPPGYLGQLQQQRFLKLAREASRRGDEDWPAIEAALQPMWMSAASLPGAPLSRPQYVVVEKILEHEEPIPPDWLTHGTVGYEFLNALGGLLVNPAGAKLCTTTYSRMTGDTLEPGELAYRCKRLIVRRSMSSELTVLAHRLDRISERNRWTRDFTLNSLATALEEVISCFEVYRTYVRPQRVLERDRKYIEAAVLRAEQRNPPLSTSIFEFLRDLLLLQNRDNAIEDEQAAYAEFVGKFQQLTGPIMAKAIEDTAFYRFNRLVCLNEVGGDPQQFGVSRAAFHERNVRRLPHWSHGLSATSTHDTKRSEDVRARIAVISEVSREWRVQVNRWVRKNETYKIDVDGKPAPSRGDEYLLYQTLIGIWPVDGKMPGVSEESGLLPRVQAYMLKVAREAKLHTSWTNPRERYEAALNTFVERLFERQGSRSFLASMDVFARRIAEHGIWNSLTQVVLKLASPGVADFFQGTEFWTFTLVDPDNRQPVDYTERVKSLDELIHQFDDSKPQAQTIAECLAELIASRHDGRMKLFTTWRGVQARRKHPQLFTAGEYIPLETSGRFAEHIVAFARQWGNERMIVIAPRWTVDVCGFGGPPPLGERWADTCVTLPNEFAGTRWTDEFTALEFEPCASMPVAEIFAEWPVALWCNSAV